MQTWLQKIFSTGNFTIGFASIKKVALFSILILFILIGYNFISYTSVQNSLKVELISGDSSILSSNNETILKRDESYFLKKGDTLKVENNSIALVIFGNGKIQTFSGYINLTFQDVEKENNAIKYSFQNKDSGENFIYRQSYGLTESTATVLGFMGGSNGNSIKGNTGNVLGASEAIKLSDEQKLEKLTKLTTCLDNAKSEANFNYSDKLSSCLDKLGLTTLTQLK